jgi:hypothetical protein
MKPHEMEMLEEQRKSDARKGRDMQDPMMRSYYRGRVEAVEIFYERLGMEFIPEVIPFE